MLYDYSKLRGKIREKFLTQNDFAKAIGIGRVSLSHKLNCKLEFSQGEINRTVDILCLGLKDIPTYFFTPKVQKTKLSEGNNNAS